jgi:alpha-L-rhamnosidase
MRWTAQTIWGQHTTNSANEWRYFRYSFDTPENLHSVSLSMIAHTTYELFVNGIFLGRGPARAFPFHAYYDTYAIESYLRPGKRNCVAVLVNHLADHTMSSIGGQPGLLCQVEFAYADGTTQTIETGRGWRTLKNAAIASHTPRISVQLEFEEQVDSRLEPSGWMQPDFDDSQWEYAVVVDSPWTHLEHRPIPFLSEDVVTPHVIKAVELARVREGYRWSFDVRHLAGTMRTGMRSAPEGERGWLIFTEIEAEAPCEVRIHPFPNYEAVPIRINNQFFERITPDQIIPLHAGRNLIMLRSVEFPALLFETDAQLIFSADRFVQGAAWIFAGLLNELNGKLHHWWTSHDLDALRGQVAMQPIYPEANTEDIFMLTSSQHFFAVEGGFCAAEINLPTPRPVLPGAHRVVEAPGACLHSSSEATTLYPQPDEDVHVVLDFGREIIGYIELEVNAAEGTILDANCFEGIDETGIFWTMQLRNSFRYICREGHQVFVSHRRRGFRYISLTLREMQRPVVLYGVRVRLSTYPVERRGAFRCSDPVLNQLWETAAYTVQLCMLDTYTDCPAYEQALWVGDARNAALVNNVAFGAHELTAHCIALTALSLSDELNAVKPPYLQREHITTSHVVSGWFNEIPMWTFLWVWTVWEHYLYTGSIDLLNQHYQAVKVCLQRCETFLSNRDFLAIEDAWNLVDWAAMDLEDEGEVTANTALMARSLDFATQMAAVVGSETDAAHFRLLAERLRATLNRYAWSEARQGYVDTLRDSDAYADYVQRMQPKGCEPIPYAEFQRKQRISECTNTLMLLCKCVPDERYEAVLRYVLAAKEGKFRGSGPHETHLTDPDEIVPVGSPWFLFFTLETLFEEGYGETAMTILREQWKRMLDKGATTFWETFPAESHDGRPTHWSRSLCHAWSAAPAYFLSSHVLGVVPLEPGYSRVVIDPKPFRLSWAEGTIPTIHGDIFVRWRIREDDVLDITYQVPDGVEVVGKAVLQNRQGKRP